jgi:nitrogen fixation protein FixH
MTHSVSDKRWPLLIVGFLGTNLLVCATLIVVATADRDGSVEPDYYQKAVAWDATAAAKRASVALGWKASWTMGALERGEREVRLSLTDSAGGAVDDAACRVQVFHQARSSDRRAVDLSRVAPGEYVARVAIVPSGLCEVRLVARRGSDSFIVFGVAHAPLGVTGGSTP